MPLSSVLGAQSLVRPGVCMSSTRPASPFEGQVIYETDTNQVLVYSGTAWVMLGDLDAPGGLQLIKTQTIGTAVSSVTVSDVFSSEFDNYKIIISGGTGSTDGFLALTLGSTSSGYYYNLVYGNYGNTTVTALNGSNVASWYYAGSFNSNRSYMDCEISDPFTSGQTQMHSQYVAGNTTGARGSFGGYLANSTSYTAFTVSTNTGTLTGGTVRVYGYRNS